MQKFTRGHINSFLKKYATDVPLLDIGTGGDEHIKLFPNRITLDIEPARNPNVVGDVYALPFGDNHFDVVVCSEVFEHLHTPSLAVSEIKRVLKPGGTLLLTTRFLFPIHEAPGDYFRYTPYSLRYLFDGWEIVELAAEADAFETIAVLLQRIIFQTDLKGGKVTKGFVYVLASILRRMDPLIRKRYGGIKKDVQVDILMSSGMYLACKKPQ